MGGFIDDLARALAKGTSRKKFLGLLGAGLLLVLAGPPRAAEARLEPLGCTSPFGCPRGYCCFEGLCEKVPTRDTTRDESCGPCLDCTAGGTRSDKCCNGGCTDTETNQNCGDCSVECAPGAGCTFGRCAFMRVPFPAARITM